MLTELDDLSQGAWFNIGQVDLLFNAGVFDHVLQELRFLGNGLLDFELALVWGNEDDSTHILIIIKELNLK